jgi:hypothetical protein
MDAAGVDDAALYGVSGWTDESAVRGYVSRTGALARAV